MTKSVTLGYHRFGDYHYFAVLGGRHRHFGQPPDKGDFKTHDEFASLVLAVHEHYHLMQNFQQGFFWWRNCVRDSFAASSVVGLRGMTEPAAAPLRPRPTIETKAVEVDPADPFSLATKSFAELLQLERSFDRATLTRSLLEADLGNADDSGGLAHEETFTLTVADLVECHAAILTELYICSLMAARPELFDEAIASDLEALFRVSSMLPTYGKPLRILLHLFDKMGLRIELPPGEVHPIYRSLRHGAVYLLLGFLLDYALHTPPDPLQLMREIPDASTLQDIWPPLRFFNLALHWSLGVADNREGCKSVLTSESGYYSQVAPLLARWINEMHAGVRERYVRTTFFSLADTNAQWLKLPRPSDGRGAFPELNAVWAAAERLRIRRPDIWFDLAPLYFDVEIGLPRLFITSSGLGTSPYFKDHDDRVSRMGTEAVKALLQRGASMHYNGFDSGEWIDADDLPVSMIPFRFVEEAMSNEMLHRTAIFLLFGGDLRCPLTESLGAFVPCKSRTPSCERVASLRRLPQDNCLLRATANRHCGGADRFGVAP